jgi:innexin
MYGGSGSIQEIDGLCFLPQNVISEKIFVFLYFWFILLCFVAIINFIIILFLLTFKFLRVRDLRRMSEHFYNRRQHSFFSYYADIGYWFVLHLIHKNLSPVLYRDFVNDLMHSREKFVKKDFKEEHDEEYMTSTSFS